MVGAKDCGAGSGGRRGKVSLNGYNDKGTHHTEKILDAFTYITETQQSHRYKIYIVYIKNKYTLLSQVLLFRLHTQNHESRITHSAHNRPKYIIYYYKYVYAWLLILI